MALGSFDWIHPGSDAFKGLLIQLNVNATNKKAFDTKAFDTKANQQIQMVNKSGK